MSLVNELRSRHEVKVPRHIAIICDGNGRWAKNKGLNRTFGHKAGTKPIEEITRACVEMGVEVLTFYAFSTENWNRTEEEVSFLMKLFKDFFIKLRKEAENNVKVRHIGFTDKLSKELLMEIRKTENATMHNSGLILNIALNYGSRIEITDAIKRIVEDVNSDNISLDGINESLVSSYMLTAGLPDVDLLIRTSGEKRISNFLLWQSAKAQLWYTDDCWPDFTCKHLKQAVNSYNRSLMTGS